MKLTLTIKAAISAKVSAHQMPSTPLKITGRIITAAIWNTSVRKNDIAADTAPFESAVKNDDEKILKPESTNENAKILNAWHVKSASSSSYPTKISESGKDSTHADIIIRHPNESISVTLFLSRLLSSV